MASKLSNSTIRYINERRSEWNWTCNKLTKGDDELDFFTVNITNTGSKGGDYIWCAELPYKEFADGIWVNLETIPEYDSATNEDLKNMKCRFIAEVERPLKKQGTTAEKEGIHTCALHSFGYKVNREGNKTKLILRFVTNDWTIPYIYFDIPISKNRDRGVSASFNNKICIYKNER